MKRKLLAMAVESIMGTDVIQQDGDWILLKASYYEALDWLSQPVLCVPDVPVMAGYSDRYGGMVGRTRVVKMQM